MIISKEELTWHINIAFGYISNRDNKLGQRIARIMKSPQWAEAIRDLKSDDLANIRPDYLFSNV